MKNTKWFLVCIAIVTLVACGSKSSSSGGGDIDPEVCGGATMGCITGNVTDSTGSPWTETDPAVSVSIMPLASAQVIKAISGTVIATANAQGWYTADNIDEGERVICFSAEGYVEVCKSVTIIATSTTSITPVALVERGDPIEVEDVQTGTSAEAVNDTTGASILFDEESSLCDSDGSPVTGDVNCYMTSIDVTADDGGLALAPSNFQVVRADGTTKGMMISSAMMAISCEQDGADLQICSGKTVEVHIPIYGDDEECKNDDTNPSPLAAWHFDEAKGMWQELDTGELTRTCDGTAPGSTGANQYYSGTIDHLGWINGDSFVSDTCLSGVVTGASGGADALATIRCHGQGWQSESYSNADGVFCVPVPVNRSFTCTAGDSYRWLGVDDYKTGTASDVDVDFPVDSCPADGCLDIGDFTFSAPIVATSLTWGAEPRDLDSHFVSRTGTQIYFDNKNAKDSTLLEKGSLIGSPYIELNADDTSAYGPEITTVLSQAADGTYRFCVRNFSGESEGGLCASSARVRVNIPGTVAETRDVPTTCPTGDNLLWQVYEIVISNGAVTRYETLDTIVQSASETSAATDCYQQ